MASKAEVNPQEVVNLFNEAQKANNKEAMDLLRPYVEKIAKGQPLESRPFLDIDTRQNKITNEFHSPTYTQEDADNYNKRAAKLDNKQTTEKRVENLELKSMATGAMEGSMVFPAMITGAKYGARLGLPGAIAGAAIGGIGAFAAGDYINEMIAEYTGTTLSDKEVQNLSERDQATNYRYTMLGSVLGGSGVTSLIGRLAPESFKLAGKTWVGRKINEAIDFAAKHPVKSLFYETSAVPLAVTLGEEFEKTGYPKMAGEFIGGVLNPGPIILWGLGKITKQAGSLMSKVSAKGVHSHTINQIGGFLQQHGDDPKAIVKLLKDPKIFDNVALQTGNPALSKLSQMLTISSPEYGKEVADQINEAQEAVYRTIALLRDSGDPEGLLQAASLEAEAFEQLMKANVAAAEAASVQDAYKLLDKNLLDDPGAMMSLSRDTKDRFGNLVRIGRETVSEYWDNIDHVPISKKNIQFIKNAYENAFEELGVEQAEEKFSSGTKKFFANIEEEVSGGRVQVTTKRLTNFYSFMMANHRDAVIAGNDVMARQYKNLADAVLEDIGTTSASMNEKYLMARQVTKSFHDLFTRSYFGPEAKQGKYGPAMSPEQLLQRAFSYGDEATELVLRDIDAVTDWMDEFASAENIQISAGEMEIIGQAQERMFKVLGSKLVKLKNAGTAAEPNEIYVVDKTEAEKFLTNYPNLSKRFPGVVNAVDQALTSEKGRLQMVAQVKEQTTLTLKKGELSLLLGKDPVKAAGAAMRETTLKTLGGMVKTAQKSEVGMMGMRAAVMESVFKSSMRDGKLDVNTFKDLLFSPHGAEKESVMEFLIKKKVFDDDDVVRVNFILDRVERIDAYKGTKAKISDLDEFNDDFVRELFEGIAVGTIPKKIREVFPDAGGHALMLAGKVSRWSGRLYKMIPRKKAADFAIELMEDKQLFIDTFGVDVVNGKIKERSSSPYIPAVQAAISGHGYGSEDETDTEVQQ